MAKSAKNWNELQDEGPLEVRVERKESFAVRSDVDRLVVRVTHLENTMERERKIALRVRIVVILLAVPWAITLLLWLLEFLAALRK